MKKLMFTLALNCGLHLCPSAKQLGGEHNIEVAFAPFGGNPINASTLKYRNFMDDDRIARDFGLEQHNNKYLVVPENRWAKPALPTRPTRLVPVQHPLFLRVGLGLRDALQRNRQLVPTSRLVRATERLRRCSATASAPSTSTVRPWTRPSGKTSRLPSGTCGTTPTS